MTSIRAPGLRTGCGVAEYGRKTVPEMIKCYRDYADHLREIVKAVDDTADNEFHVETYIGKWAERNREIIQQGRVIVTLVDAEAANA